MSLVGQFAGLDACAVSDALDRLGIPGRVVDGIVPLASRGRLVGRAVTVQLDAPTAPSGGTAGQAPAPRHLGTSAVEVSGPSNVIVVAHQGRLDCAGWGGNLARAARFRGVAGVVVDGAVRDVDEMRDIGFVAYGRGSTPRTARGRTREVTFNEPVVVAGVTVSPGDLVVADATGVVFVPAAIVDEVLATALEIVRVEAAMADRIERGEPVGSVMGASYENQLKGSER